MTVAFDFVSARFRTVKCVLTTCTFLLTSLIVEARNKRKSAALNAFYTVETTFGVGSTPKAGRNVQQSLSEIHHHLKYTDFVITFRLYLKLSDPYHF